MKHFSVMTALFLCIAPASAEAPGPDTRSPDEKLTAAMAACEDDRDTGPRMAKITRAKKWKTNDNCSVVQDLYDAMQARLASKAAMDRALIDAIAKTAGK